MTAVDGKKHAFYFSVKSVLEFIYLCTKIMKKEKMQKFDGFIDYENI